MSEPTVTHHDRQYQITVDGEQAGFADYIEAGEQRIFHHTVIDKAFGGRGLAGTLVGAALDDTRAAGKRVDYITYGGAGHQRSSWGWARQLHASRASEDFLANCLGGRSAGFDLYEAAAWAFR